MKYHIVGLGNPSDEYKKTRHNVGRIILESFRKVKDFPDWQNENKTKTLVSKGILGKDKITLIEPNNFMNNSGKNVAKFVKGVKSAERMIVIYDDLDLAIGEFKISFAKSSGGHRGVESIIKSLKTKNFIRVRVGIAPKTLLGKIKKPRGEKAVLDFIMRNFTSKEEIILKKISKLISGALEIIITDGQEKAMNKFN